MFARRPKRQSVEVNKLSSFIAEDVEIVGDLRFVDGLRIDGLVRGNVVGRPGEGGARALLVLSAKGRIEGNIRCGDAVVNGSVTGDLDIEHLLELQETARVCGAIRYAHLQMDVGASVHGQLQRVDPAAQAEPADPLEQPEKAAQGTQTGQGQKEQIGQKGPIAQIVPSSPSPEPKVVELALANGTRGPTA